MKLRALIVASLFGFALASCSDDGDGGPSADSGVAGDIAATQETGASEDTGTTTEDTGTTTEDTGTTTEDTGTTTEDTGTTVDSVVTADSGTTADSAATADTIVTADTAVASDQGPGTDATGPQTAERVLFSKHSYSDTMFNFVNVNTDGTGYTEYTTGILDDVNVVSIFLSGVNSATDIRRDQPVRSSGPKDYLYGNGYLHLPGGNGQLYRWKSTFASASTGEGIVQLRPDATAVPLDKGPYESRFAVSADGKLAAGVKSSKKLMLFRLDGTNWSGGSSALLEVSIAGWTGTKVLATSLTMTSKSLYFVTQKSYSNSSERVLWRVALDGASAASKVTLPQVDSSAVVFISDTLVRSPDGKTIGFLAGPSASKAEFVVIPEGIKTPKLMTGAVDAYLAPAGNWMNALNPRLALSNGGAAAFASSTKAWAVSKAGTKAELSTTANFDSAVVKFGGFSFTDDDNLLFWAGKDDKTLDLFHYVLSSGTLTALTKSGAASAAPWGEGKLRCHGGWIAPGGGMIYYVAGTTVTSGTSTTDVNRNIIGVKVSGHSKVDITTGLDINFSKARSLMESHLTQPDKVWFVAREAGKNNDELYVFDQKQGTVATKLSQLPTGSSGFTVHSFAFSPNLKTISLVGKPDYNSNLYVMSISGGAATKLADKVTDTHAWTSDSGFIVYAGSSKSNLMMVGAAGGGTPTEIYKDSAGTRMLHVFAVAKP